MTLLSSLQIADGTVQDTAKWTHLGLVSSGATTQSPFRHFLDILILQGQKRHCIYEDSSILCACASPSCLDFCAWRCTFAK